MDLRRAISTIYYALFHKLAETCSNLLVGTPGAATSEHAWMQVYRAVNHGTIARRCGDSTILRFPDEIQDFAFLFRGLQFERERCDYKPDYEPPPKAAVEAKIVQAQKCLDAFDQAPEKDRRAFAVYVLIESQRHRDPKEPEKPVKA